MSDLTFYTNPMSRGQMVRWMLEETGAPYETEILQYGTTMKAPEYLAINPMGKVPAIKHKGVVVTEVAAILAHLADAFPENNLAPTLGERGAYYRWLFFGAGPVESAITAKALGFEPAPEQKAMAGFGEMADVLNTLEALVSDHEFIAANHFTAADLYIGAELDFGMSFNTIEKRDAFVAYRDRVTDLDAYRRAKDIDNALIAQQQQQQ